MEPYNFITLVKTLGAIYSSVNHAEVAQQELGRGLKQGGKESVVCFLERVQETFSQAYGPPVGWSAYHCTKLVESVVKGLSNKRLADLIATYQIFSPSSTSKMWWCNLLNKCPTLLRRKRKYLWLKELALRVINQVMWQGIAWSRGSCPLFTAVTKWGTLLPSVEPGMSTVTSAEI